MMQKYHATKSRQSSLASLPQMVTTRPHSTEPQHKKSVPSLVASRVASRPSSVPSKMHLIPIKTRSPGKRGKSVQMWLNTPARRRKKSIKITRDQLPELDRVAAEERKRLKYLWQAASPMTRRKQAQKLFKTGKSVCNFTYDSKRDAVRLPLLYSS